MTAPAYEFVIYGATSFVGQIMCQYIIENYAEGEVRWAAAGRSQDKLDKLVASLGRDIDTIVAAADDEPALQSMVVQAQVILSTVGPYALYGSPLIKVCAQSGTDYCDLTGEPQWIRRMISAHEEEAKASGARLVHCCGFDSIPFDMGNFYLQQQSQQQYGAAATTVKMAVNKMQGGGSGGTIASAINMIKEASKDAQLRKDLGNPYYFCSADHGFTASQRNVTGAVYDDEFQSWVGPFIMAAINTKIVHRSNELSGKAFGEQFKYDEVMITGNSFAARMGASSIGIGMGFFALMVALPPTRYVVEALVPKPGEGPSPEAQLNGFFDLSFVGKTENGEALQVRVTGDRDPGYGCTAKMLVQSGLCLARDVSKDDKPGGFWTPATAMGDALVTRLVDGAGMTFTVEQA